MAVMAGSGLAKLFACSDLYGIGQRVAAWGIRRRTCQRCPDILVGERDRWTRFEPATRPPEMGRGDQGSAMRAG